jgi:hypothetical protein
VTQAVVNVGTLPGDGTGDKGQVPFSKVNANFTELYGNALFVGADTGVVNAALVAAIAPNPASFALSLNTRLLFTPAIANTGPATLSVLGNTPTAIVNAAGAPLIGGELQPLTPTLVLYNGTAWQILIPNTAALLTQIITQSIIGAVFYPRTANEGNAAAAISSFQYPEGNVLRYGADPTGVMASNIAFQTAMAVTVNSAGSSGLGNCSPIYIPRGQYLINNNTLPVMNNPLGPTGNVRRGIMVYGDAMGGTRINCVSGGSTNVFWWFNPALDSRFTTTEQSFINLCFRDLYFLGDFPANVNFFNAYQSQGFDFERCYFNTFNTLLASNGAAGGDSWKFRHCRATEGGNVILGNNPQMVNTEFHSCDWESWWGNIYYFGPGGGGAMRQWGGSIIMSNSTAFTGSVSGTVLTTSALTGTIPGSGGVIAPIALGMVVQGAGVPVNMEITAQLSGPPGGVGGTATWTVNNPAITTVASTSMTTMAYIVSLNGGTGLGGFNGTYLIDGVQTQQQSTQTGTCNITQAGSQVPVVCFRESNFTSGTVLTSRLMVSAQGGRVRFVRCGLTQNPSDTYSMTGNATGDQYGDPGTLEFFDCNVLATLPTLITLAASSDGLIWGTATARKCFQGAYNPATPRTSRTALDFDLNGGNQGFCSNGRELLRAWFKPLNRQWPDSTTTFNWTLTLPPGALIVRTCLSRTANAGGGSNTWVANLGYGTGGTLTAYGSSASSALNVTQTWIQDSNPAGNSSTAVGFLLQTSGTYANQITLSATTSVTGAAVGSLGEAWVEYYTN